jgi:hypothetical protein
LPVIVDTIFTLKLLPHGTSLETALDTEREDLRALQRGIQMYDCLTGAVVTVRAAIAMFPADHMQALVGCRALVSNLIVRVLDVADLASLMAAFCDTKSLTCLHRCSKASRQAVAKHMVPRVDWPCRLLMMWPPALPEWDYVRLVIVTDDFPRVQAFLVRLAARNVTTRLTFGGVFNSPLADNQLPDGLLELRFGNQYMCSCPVLPRGLTRLVFGTDALPDSEMRRKRLGRRRTLQGFIAPRERDSFGCGPFFADIFDPAPPKWPDSLVELELRWEFNRHLSLDDLPPALRKLTLGPLFDQPLLRNVLPQGLTHLEFGPTRCSFNHPLPPGVLPDSLTFLSFGDRRECTLSHEESRDHMYAHVQFNQAFQTGSLPANLTHLILGPHYSGSHLTDANTPSSLAHLWRGKVYVNRRTDSLPDSRTFFYCL